MTEKDDRVIYSIAEAARYLSKELNEKYKKKDVTMLAKEGLLKRTLRGVEAESFSRKQLKRCIKKLRMLHHDSEPLSEESRSLYLKLPVWQWWEALYIVNGVTPSDLSIQDSAFSFRAHICLCGMQ